MTFKLITFDVYMALVDIQGSLTPVVGEALSIDEETAFDFVKLWRVKQMECAALSNSLANGHKSFRECTELALDYIIHKKNMNISEIVRKKLVYSWHDLMPWPEALSVIKEIKLLGYEVAILSNGDQQMLNKIATKFENAFEHILSAELAQNFKPHPSVYELPITHLGFAKNEILHVAGSSTDVVGARAFGIKCYWSNRSHDRVIDAAFKANYEDSDLNGIVKIMGI